MSDYAQLIRDVPDFPKAGIVFKDITPLLGDAQALVRLLDDLADSWRDQGITKVVGVESRGFLLAPGVAERIGAGVVLARKPGKLPWKTVVTSYTLEYGSETSEMHTDAIKRDDNVIIVDDLLATGGTAMAATQLVKQLGGNIAEIDFLIELGFLKGRDRLKEFPLFSAIVY